jgi:hypothetical protein
MTNEEKEELKYFYQNSKLIFTDHALEQAKKRFSLNKEAIIRLTKEAIANGEFFIHIPTKDDDISYSFVFKEKIFVIGDSRDYITKEHVTALLTIYPRGKNTELDKNYKTFIKGKPIVKQGFSGKKYKNLAVKADRKNNKHKQF